VPVTARLQRRIRYWRIVTAGNPTCIARFDPQGEAAIGGDRGVIRSRAKHRSGGRSRLGRNWMQPPMRRATVQSTWRLNGDDMHKAGTVMRNERFNYCDIVSA
jgi:hypothetical protein